MKIEIIALAIIAAVAFAVKANGVEVSDRLLNAIYQVESKGGKFLKGDKSKKTGEYRAIGPFQLWKCYVDDVNSILKNKGISKRYTYSDRWSYHKSREMVIIYLKHYGRQFEIDSERYITKYRPELKGKIKVYCNDTVLSMIHNGGPKGYNKKVTLEYWSKIEKHL
jgi:hypothetical protein